MAVLLRFERFRPRAVSLRARAQPVRTVLVLVIATLCWGRERENNGEGNRQRPAQGANIAARRPPSTSTSTSRRWGDEHYGVIRNSSRLSTILQTVDQAAIAMGSTPSGNGPSGSVASFIACSRCDCNSDCASLSSFNTT